MPKKWVPTQGFLVHVNSCFFVEMDVRGEGDHRKNYLVEKIFYFSIKKCLKPHLGFTHGYKVGTSIRNGAYNTRNTYIYDVFGRTESDVFAVRTEPATSKSDL
jgi:hypothetical protein